MIILPAIDLKDGKCVRLFQGDYATAEQVAEDPVKTAQSFEEQGARWVHLVDLDGAKARRPVNDSTVFSIRDNVSMNIEVGGGIRDMDTVEYYLSHGINRIILGSAALHSPEFVREAVKKYGKKIKLSAILLSQKLLSGGTPAGQPPHQPRVFGMGRGRFGGGRRTLLEKGSPSPSNLLYRICLRNCCRRGCSGSEKNLAGGATSRICP